MAQPLLVRTEKSDEEGFCGSPGLSLRHPEEMQRKLTGCSGILLATKDAEAD